MENSTYCENYEDGTEYCSRKAGQFSTIPLSRRAAGLRVVAPSTGPHRVATGLRAGYTTPRYLPVQVHLSTWMSQIQLTGKEKVITGEYGESSLIGLPNLVQKELNILQ